MRTIVRGRNTNEIEKKIAYKEKQGWNKISDIQRTNYHHYDEELVCVMEKEDLNINGKKWGKDPNFQQF